MNISLIAEAASGKDFLSDYLVTKYGYTRYAFADNVKSVAETWFPDSYGIDGEKPRALLQAVGTKFREIDKDVWINTMFEDIDAQEEIAKRYNLTSESIVVTDCRMPNEYQALKDRGFKFIRIDVDDETRVQRMRDRGDTFTEKDLLHHTEQHYSEFECKYHIDNSGSKESAYEQLDRIMDRLADTT